MISENILILRKKSGLSQEQTAEKIGVSRQAVAKWESGETTPDIVNSAALARLFDVTLDELVNGPEEKQYGVPIAPRGKYIFGTVTVGDRGQIVIPVKARKVFDIKPGDDLLVLGDIKRGLAITKQSFLLDMMRGGLEEDEDE